MYNVIRICILLFLILVAVLISRINFNKTELANCGSLSNLDQKLIDINNFSSFEADLEIDDWRKWQLINIKDLINYDTFNQFTNRTRVSGTIILKKVSGKIINCKLKVALRPHGDQKDHRDGNYLPSLQVKIIDSNLFGITDFLLLRPKQRGYYNEVFVTSLMRSINLLAPRTSMVSINFSNKNYSFIFQEKIRKEFLEFSGFKEGPIIEGDERFVFNQGDVPFVNHRISNINYVKRSKENEYNSEYSLSVLNFYGSTHNNSIHRNWLVDYYKLAFLNKREDFIDLDIFDAIMFATDSLAGLSVQDRRFYYNPVDNKFYPIFYDGIPKLIDKSKKFIPRKVSTNNLTEIKKEYISFTLPSMFSGKVSYSAKKGSSKALKLIENLNSEKFNNEIIKLGLKLENNELEKILEALKNRLKKIDSFGARKIFDFSEPNKNIFKNYFTNRYINEKIIFYSEYEKKYYLCEINFKNCTLENKNNFNKAKLLSQEAKFKNKNIIFTGKKLTKNLFTGWYFSENNSNFNKKIISDFELQYSNGITIETDKKNKIIKIEKKFPNSRVLILNQSVEDWTFIFQDNTDQLDSYKKSIFKDIYGNTGCITFYNSQLKNLNFLISNSKCEDGINFINSTGSINSLNLENSISDAVDFDFSILEINKINISNSSNDCVDFSFGKYKINYLRLKNCGDKAISIGENSNVDIKNVDINFSNIGVASKDSSQTKIDQYNLENVKYCFSVYNKKQEFFGSNLEVNSGNCKNYIQDIDIDNMSIFKKDGEIIKEGKISSEININDFVVESKVDLIREVSHINDDKTYNAVIEISKNTNAKWQISKIKNQFEQEFYKGKPRIINYKPYPANYGIIPQTVLPINSGGDGDPLDVFVIGEQILRGEIIKIRPIATVKMFDYGEMDDKIIAIKSDDKKFKNIKSLEDMKAISPNEIEQLISWLKNYKGKNIVNIIKIENLNFTKELIDYANKNYTRKGISIR